MITMVRVKKTHKETLERALCWKRPKIVSNEYPFIVHPWKIVFASKDIWNRKTNISCSMTIVVFYMFLWYVNQSAILLSQEIMNMKCLKWKSILVVEVYLPEERQCDQRFCPVSCILRMRLRSVFDVKSLKKLTRKTAVDRAEDVEKTVSLMHCEAIEEKRWQLRDGEKERRSYHHEGRQQ